VERKQEEQLSINQMLIDKIEKIIKKEPKSTSVNLKNPRPWS